MIFLSKNGEDGYINQFCQGSNGQLVNTNDFVYDESTDPIVLRGILKDNIMKKCWRDSRDFYYVDTGYFGNEKTPANPNGWKYWHRIVKNNLQHGEIIPRPDDRFKQFNKKFNPWKKAGRKILVAAPDEKPCKFYDTTKDEWVQQTVETIKKYTDRPIVVRDKATRQQRISNTIFDDLKDCHALVTYQSIAAVESVLHGVPAFTLAPTAADPVCDKDLSRIESPTQQDSDKIYKWACHLAYGQFHIEELQSGIAHKILMNENC
jgi:hypothetical protein